MTVRPQRVTFPDGILAQHAHLTKSVGGLRKAHDEGAEWSELAAMLDELLETVRLHFASEEGEMERGGYPKLAEHRKLHHTFMRRLETLRAECDHGQTELMSALAGSLEAWLKNHERTADKDVLEFLGLMPPPIPPARSPSES